jgi:hypothetical protein
METLPHIDEHAVPTQQPPEVVWRSLLRSLGATMQGAHTFGRVLGVDPLEPSPAFEGRVGQTLTGFRVVDAVPNQSLVLEGRHRFSRYRLSFQIAPGKLIARTDAAFPGLGRLYRAAVIGSGAHGLITKQLLRRIARG